MDEEINHVDSDDLMTPAQVAEAFRVDPKTVTRWAKAGKLAHVRTLGGHRRFVRADVQAQLDKTRVTSKSTDES